MEVFFTVKPLGATKYLVTAETIVDAVAKALKLCAADGVRLSYVIEGVN
jgi:hypothetical protein